MWPLLWSALAGAFAGAGDLCLKLGAQSVGRSWTVGGAALWACSAVLFARALRLQPLLVAGTTFVTVNAVIVVVLSQVVFREPVLPLQWAGIALAVIALVLIEL